MSYFDRIVTLVDNGVIDAYDTFYEAKARFPELSTKECKALHEEVMQAIADYESETSQRMYDR